MTYGISFRCTTVIQFDIFIHYKKITMINLVTICHDTKLLPYYRVYSPCCTLHPYDLFHNCKFVPLNLPRLFPSSATPLPSGNHHFVSVSESETESTVCTKQLKLDVLMPSWDGLSLIAMWLQAVNWSSQPQCFNLENGKNKRDHAEHRRWGLATTTTTITLISTQLSRLPTVPNHCRRCFFARETWAST